MLIFSLFLIFVSIFIISFLLVPLVVAKSSQMNQDRAQALVAQVDRHLKEEDVKKMYRLALYGPIVLGIAGGILFPPGSQIIGVIAGAIIGYVLPRMYIGKFISDRREKFNDQMVDALMIMASSFRGGLSLVQSFESVVDEMPDPAKGEFGVVLGENKMGVSLDESLNRLYNRMPSPAMQQMVSAILLARETGGNLPVIFMRIVNSTRERKKIEKSLQTLTIQGKIQAVVMTGLPIFFFFTVSGSNPHFFDDMLHSPTGQKLLTLCVVLWVLGALSIWKISTFKET